METTSGSPKRPGTIVVAAVLMAVQFAVGAMAGLWLLTSETPRRRELLGDALAERRFLLGVGAVVMLVALGVAFFALVRSHRRAAIAVSVVEGLTIAGHLARFGARPGVAVIGVVVSTTIITLVALSTTPATRARSEREDSTDTPTATGIAAPAG